MEEALELVGANDTKQRMASVERLHLHRHRTPTSGHHHRTPTYIDCLHLKKTDCSKMHLEDPMEVENDICRKENEPSLDYADKVEQLKELSKQPDIYERLNALDWRDS
nr:DNA replication licensing factor MCM4 [Ipomoea batatas]